MLECAVSVQQQLTFTDYFQAGRPSQLPNLQSISSENLITIQFSPEDEQQIKLCFADLQCTLIINVTKFKISNDYRILTLPCRQSSQVNNCSAKQVQKSPTKTVYKVVYIKLSTLTATTFIVNLLLIKFTICLLFNFIATHVCIKMQSCLQLQNLMIYIYLHIYEKCIYTYTLIIYTIDIYTWNTYICRYTNKYIYTYKQAYIYIYTFIYAYTDIYYYYLRHFIQSSNINGASQQHL